MPRWEAVIADLGGARAHVFELAGGDPVWLVLRLYREFLVRAQAAESSIESLVYELCAHVVKRSAEEFHEPVWLKSVDETVHERFRQPLDLTSLASGVGVHPTHLCRVYRRFRGRTISEAVAGARLQYVARRLTDSEESLTDIAGDAGFADQSHMTKAFKRMTGYPPGEHRRLHGSVTES